MAEELDKIYIRTGLCLLILLIFVFLVNRSWRSTLIVTAALTVNILIAVAACAFLQIPVHIYTMAGITVSLGIVIDTTIVMADHYGYYRNRGAFPDLVAAILTTVAALLLILLLPESERGNLTDFIWVISINLCISLAVAFFFIPALMEYFPVHRTDCSASFKDVESGEVQLLVFRIYFLGNKASLGICRGIHNCLRYSSIPVA